MPLFYYLPKSAIAAIVMVAAAKLIEFHLKFLIKVTFEFHMEIKLFATEI
jgi:MFS superfamily sulfate permease-like transporter